MTVWTQATISSSPMILSIYPYCLSPFDFYYNMNHRIAFCMGPIAAMFGWDSGRLILFPPPFCSFQATSRLAISC